MVIILKYFNKKVYEGEEKEFRKQARKKWLSLFFWAFLLPLLIASACSIYNDKISIQELFCNGDVLLALYSVTVPVILDLFEIKKNNSNKLSSAFNGFLLLIIFQTIFFVLIKGDNSSHPKESIIFSCVIVLSSLIWCLHALYKMATYKNEERSVDENDE
mgnify:CR=1 FL=1